MELEKLIDFLSVASSFAPGSPAQEILSQAAETLRNLKEENDTLKSQVRDLDVKLRCEREHREKLAYWLQGKTPKAEQQAIFRLGQKDMQANAAAKLRDAAAKMKPGGVVGSTLLLAADLIQGMEVP